jgi:hypothetical protein
MFMYLQALRNLVRKSLYAWNWMEFLKNVNSVTIFIVCCTALFNDVKHSFVNRNTIQVQHSWKVYDWMQEKLGHVQVNCVCIHHGFVDTPYPADGQLPSPA